MTRMAESGFGRSPHLLTDILMPIHPRAVGRPIVFQFLVPVHA
jgi:hypothetical protein